MNNQHLRRALRFVTPYWRRLALVLIAQPAEHGPLALCFRSSRQDFFDHALLGRDLRR